MKLKLLFSIFSILFFYSINSQISPPYQTSFEVPDSSWSSYSLSGTPNIWQRGSGNNSYAIPNTGNFSWCTNLNGPYSDGFYCLESPSFNLSDTNNQYVISFFHKYDFSSSTDNLNYNSGKIQYSIDNGQNWQIFTPSNLSQTYRWHETKYNDLGFFHSISYFIRSRASLEDFKGMSNVKFRFCSSAYDPIGSHLGWDIDDFEIKTLPQPDIIALTGSHTSNEPSNKANFDINFKYFMSTEYGSFNAKSYIYHSLDNILDSSDLLIDSITNNFYGLTYSIPYTLNNTGFIQSGMNYIFCKFDINDSVIEQNEANNTSHSTIDTEAVYSLPYKENFETISPDIKEYSCINITSDCQETYQTNRGNTQLLSGAHSGINGWTTKYNYSSIIFPFIELTGNNVIHFFYKNKGSINSTMKRLDYVGNNKYWTNIPNSTILEHNNKGWGSFNCFLPPSSEPIFKYRLDISPNYNFIMDDLYIGPSKPDLLINEIENFRTSNSTISSDTLHYYFSNSGTEPCTTSTTKFYYSLDSILDISDQLLGQNTELPMTPNSGHYNSFSYIKPNLNISNYYIIGITDSDSIINEMREDNNSTTFIIKQLPTIQAPYFNDFETSITDWFHISSYKQDVFIWANQQHNYPGIQNKALGAENTIIPLSDSRSSLYSPVFDLSNLSNPVLSFDLALNSAELNLNYSIDGGATWQTLTPNNKSFKKWYNIYEFNKGGGIDLIATQNGTKGLLDENTETVFPSNYAYMSKNDDGTENSIIDLSFLKHETNLQFRFDYGVDKNDSTSILFIDNFLIEEADIDLTIDYIKNLYLSPQTTDLKFDFYIRNLGNYISDSTSINFYLSSDTIIDNSDLLISSNFPIDQIGPDQVKWFFYRNQNLQTGSLAGKNYILFEIDNQNLILESNEQNNNSYYRINNGGVSSYPYLETFNNYEVHGWKSYNYDRNGVIFSTGHRYVNKKYSALNFNLDGLMTMDNCEPTSYYYPTIYLESPSFNISTLDSLFISFNYATSTLSNEGTNMEYSTDGGNNWSVLGMNNNPEGVNWYNGINLDELNNEYGWRSNGCNQNFYTSIYNASSLCDSNTNVIFRFKSAIKSQCYYPNNQGFSVDNFKISQIRPFTDLIALNHGDTLEIERFSQVPTIENDTISLSIFNNGSLTPSSSIELYWSNDTIYDANDFLAGTIYSRNLTSYDTNYFSKIIQYPSQICDSFAYLIYKINPQIFFFNYSIHESNYNNNQGYLTIKLKNSNLNSPPNNLNISSDTVLCQGQTLPLYIDSDYSGFYTTWNNGINSPILEVNYPGTYSATLTTSAGCQSISDSVYINFTTNEVNILTDDSTTMCIGDSIQLYILEEGIVNWSNSNNHDSVTTVYGAGTYSVQLTSQLGCNSFDTIEINMDLNERPIISDIDTTHFCKDYAIISHESNIKNTIWSTGETTNSILITPSDTLIYLTKLNTCGLNTSDSLIPIFHNIIDSISPNDTIEACLGTLVEIVAHTSNLNDSIIWRKVSYNSYNNYLYEEEFDTYNFSSYEIQPTAKWSFTSNDTLIKNKIINGGNSLIIKPSGTTITFATDYIDISNLYNMELEVYGRNNLQDSIYIYYELDNQPRKRFEMGGSWGNGGPFGNYSGTSTQNIISGSLVRIIIEFNGTPYSIYDSQELSKVSIRGTYKNESNILDGDSSYSFNLSSYYEGEYIVTADNGFCEEKKLITVSQSEIENLEFYRCGNQIDTVCVDLPTDYSVIWNSEPIILDTIGNCIVFNAGQNFSNNIHAIVTNEIGCSENQTIYFNSGVIDTSLSLIGNTISSNQQYRVYQWIDCNSSAIIPNATNQDFTPLVDGNYAVEISSNNNRCTATSECIELSCIEIPFIRKEGETLISSNTSDNNSYTWINCNDSSILFNQVDSTYTPTQSGSYAVIINSGSCIDTTECYDLLDVNIYNNTSNFKIYPNPSSNFISVTPYSKYETIEIKLINTINEVINIYYFKSNENITIDINQLSKGVYFIEIKQDDYVKILKFIKN